jgi:hypothetical protein
MAASIILAAETGTSIDKACLPCFMPGIIALVEMFFTSF